MQVRDRYGEQCGVQCMGEWSCVRETYTCIHTCSCVCVCMFQVFVDVVRVNAYTGIHMLLYANVCLYTAKCQGIICLCFALHDVTTNQVLHLVRVHLLVFNEKGRQSAHTYFALFLSLSHTHCCDSYLNLPRLRQGVLLPDAA